MATEITLENVQSVYSGKPGCACGCLGKHTYPQSARGRGKEIRGYDIGEDEISDRTVKILFNKVFGGKYGEPKGNGKLTKDGWVAWSSLQEAIDGDEKIFFIETDTNIKVIYFKGA